MHISTPCHEDWNGMTTVTGGRHCAACNQPVVDLSDLDTAARRQRLDEISHTVASGKRVCVRGRVDRDGALAGTRRLLTGGMAALLAMSIAGCHGNGLESAEQPTAPPTTTTTNPAPVTGSPAPSSMGFAAPTKMGDVAVPPPVVPQPVPAPPIKGKIVAPPPAVPRLMGEVCVKPPSATTPTPTDPQAPAGDRPHGE